MKQNGEREAEGFDQQSVLTLKGVGPKVAERLARVGVQTVQDVLFHLPLRYQDRTRIVAIGALRPGDQAVIEGVIDAADIRFGKRRSLLVRLSDGTGSLTLRFFHFSNAQKAGLVRGIQLRCYGEVRPGPGGYEMVHPEYKRVEELSDADMDETLTPIYPSTEGMHQLSWRGLTQHAIAQLRARPEALPELLPQKILRRFRLPGLVEALLYLHQPPADAPQDQLLEGQHPAQQRLAFEELMAHQLSLLATRARQRALAAPALVGEGHLQSGLRGNLPFQLTAAQERAVKEVASDLGRTHPMMRLVQGDVGSGKTVVSAIATLQAVEAGYQVALMAPTELLAEQHWQNFSNWLQPLGLQPLWLAGRHKGKARGEILKQIGDGDCRVVVGTHALFQEEVAFAKLGLVIIDEQHRFGVHQRMSLRDKQRQEGYLPHQLIMTATPIPRTLAMTAYADLDLSVIDELPPGRTPVGTVAIPDSRRDEVVAKVRQACQEGRQVYWVCTLIEESEALQCQAAEESLALLQEQLPEVEVDMVHGRMKAQDKASVMQRFKQGDVQLLVATTVIEVGVDVPNASLMIIENPERLGLAQLHQLRGRVGRGAAESHCLLMYHPPLSTNAQARLSVMRETNDGFRIAQKDLELRGPGEVLGTRQTGALQFRIADLLRDQSLLDEVKQAADSMLQQAPQQVPRLVRRWVGENVQYIHA